MCFTGEILLSFFIYWSFTMQYSPSLDHPPKRLITRSDFDGLVCAILLKRLGLINDILFVHPRDMQYGNVKVTSNDITTNLPYVAEAFLAFDHHASETLRNIPMDNHIIIPSAPSAARVVYDYYGGYARFGDFITKELMDAVDKADAAQFTLDDVLEPKGWELLSFIMDSRTGLGRFRNFRISNYQLMMDLIDHCTAYPIEHILQLPDVKERTDLYFHYHEKAKEQILRNSTVYGNLVVLDLRPEEVIYPINRFIIYALFPECNISIHVMWGREKQNTVLATGKSILNRTSNTDVGELMLFYGGGGHTAAGTCQIENEQVDKALQQIITQIVTEG